MSRLTAYICAPYAGDIEKNIERAKRYAEFTHSRDYTPVTPHLMFPFLDDSKQEDRYDCLNMCSDVMKMCDEVFVFGDKLTEGMLYELSQWDSSVYIFTDEMVDKYFEALEKKEDKHV